MAEYIDREEYCEKYCRCSNEYCDRQSCPIWKAPAADVASVVHGHWVEDLDDMERSRGKWKFMQGGSPMKVYIAGKITGNENYKAEFAEAEKKLRTLGHIPLNPAVLPEGLEKADYMRICLAMLDSADAIALMLNWTGSPGANIELSLAMYTGKKQIDLWTIPNL